jgi:hypothetical protein
MAQLKIALNKEICISRSSAIFIRNVFLSNQHLGNHKRETLEVRPGTYTCMYLSVCVCMYVYISACKIIVTPLRVNHNRNMTTHFSKTFQYQIASEPTQPFSVCYRENEGTDMHCEANRNIF